MGNTINIDPDFRVKVQAGDTRPRCVCCQKLIKNLGNAIAGFTSAEGFKFTVEPSGKEYMGQACFKKTVKGE